MVCFYSCFVYDRNFWVSRCVYLTSKYDNIRFIIDIRDVNKYVIYIVIKFYYRKTITVEKLKSFTSHRSLPYFTLKFSSFLLLCTQCKNCLGKHCGLLVRSSGQLAYALRPLDQETVPGCSVGNTDTSLACCLYTLLRPSHVHPIRHFFSEKPVVILQF